MLLKKLIISNFRCYGNNQEFPFHQLTVFIGENDAGKTVILDALELLLTNKTPAPNDYRRIGDLEPVDTIAIQGTFQLELAETIPDDWHAPGSREFTLIKTFNGSGSKCEVLGLGYEDDRCYRFDAQSAAVQQALLQGVGILPESNKQKRSEQFQQANTQGKFARVIARISVPFLEILSHLPRFQRVSSADYRQPETLIQNTLQAVIDSYLKPRDPTTGEPTLRDDLVGVAAGIDLAINAKLGEMKDVLEKANPSLRGVKIQPTVDFAKAVSARGLLLDAGQGYKPVETFGEGTKKKLWMGLLDWLNAINLQMADVPVLRVYDEPDVNLDYAAERRLFAGILDVVSKQGSRTQVVVCTHTVTLVDRAPAHSINLIRVASDGTRGLVFLIGTDDSDVATFLAIMGRTVGISNSALFYERAFLVVEGESEENALPILYRQVYGRSLIEDGIVLIDLHTCGAWRSILKILQRNKSDVTTMLLDYDCTDPNSSAYMTSATLIDVGYPPDFQQQNCYYIGTKEFEDAFATQDIVVVLNSHYPKSDGSPWTVAEVDQLRYPGGKFSHDLLAQVRNTCDTRFRPFVRKPDFAEKLAQQCKTAAQIPQPILDVFVHTRRLAGH